MSGSRRPHRGLLSRLSGVRTLGLFDQAAVSAANFAAVFIIARATSAAELGVYSLGLTIVVLVLAVHESLVGAPYIVYCNRREVIGSELRLYTGSGLAHTAVIGLAATALLGLVYLLSRLGVLPPLVGGLAVGLMLAVIPSLFRDFARRFSLAHSRMALLVSVDLLVSGSQVGLLLLLAASGSLDAANAYAALAVACTAGTVLWLMVVRRELAFSLARIRSDAVGNWRFGRWVLACSVATVLQGYSVHWVLVVAHGAAATGVFEALRSTANLINPLITGLRNVVGPLSARGYARRGPAGVWRVVLSSVRPLALLGALFVLGLAALGEPFMELVFGPGYAGYRWGLVVIGTANLAFGLSALADQGLWALERPDLNAKAATASLAVTVAAAVALVPAMVVLGGALAYLTGRLVEGIYRYLALQFVITRETAASRGRPVPAGDARG